MQVCTLDFMTGAMHGAGYAYPVNAYILNRNIEQLILFGNIYHNTRVHIFSDCFCNPV
jgi:hypothetical protein